MTSQSPPGGPDRPFKVLLVSEALAVYKLWPGRSWLSRLFSVAAIDSEDMIPGASVGGGEPTPHRKTRLHDCDRAGFLNVAVGVTRRSESVVCLNRICVTLFSTS